MIPRPQSNRLDATLNVRGPITGVEVVDPLTVNVKFSAPFGAFIPFMADPLGSE